MTRDLSDESRRTLEKRIQHVQKLESLGVLAGGIAHDFNNLLVAILGHAGLALMELPPESPARARVETIEAAAMRAAELTRQLLVYSGKGMFQIQPINLSLLVEEMSTLLGVSVSKKIEFISSLPGDLPAIEADVAQIQQVVMNLLTNASEAIGDVAGTITVRTGVEEVKAEEVKGDSQPAGHYVFLEVSDSGTGIDAETRLRIFDPFFTTKISGRGLGLAAVLGIVRAHKGAIGVNSIMGQGTTFKVMFPSTGKPAAVDLEPAIRPNRNWRGSGTILVIDDEEGVRIVARLALEKVGFTVLTAEDGREGLKMFRLRPGAITAVLLDMAMPHMSGEEVFRELMRVSPTVPVILSSGYSEQEATNLFVGKRLAGFIQKPYQPRTLIDTVRSVLESGREALGPRLSGVASGR